MGEIIAMLIFISEFLGTALLILLGCGVVANVRLEKSGMKGAGALQIAVGWGLAVLLPVFIFGSSSGAHLNPALSIALAADGSITWNALPLYVCGQMLGGFAGAVCVWLLFRRHFEATSDADTKLGVFCTAPSIPDFSSNMLSEIIGTFVLVFAIKGLANVDCGASGTDKIFVFAAIVSIGVSLGGLTGYAINPARDISPRLAHAILPIPGKRNSNWRYAIVPLLGPIIGALLAVLVYHLIPWQVK